MKIDFDMLDRLEKAGATAAVIIAILREGDIKKGKKRARDAKRMRDTRATKSETKRRSGDKERHEATSPPKPTDINRVRIFALKNRLANGAGISDARAGEVLGAWCKLTHDNAAAIETAIATAEQKQPADFIGFVRACLQDRNRINGTHRQGSLAAAADDLIERARTLERTGGIGESADPFGSPKTGQTIDGTMAKSQAG